MSVVDEAKAAGYTHVRTYGGPLPLDDWRPYGRLPEEAKAVTFHLGDGAINEEAVDPTFVAGGFFVLGSWPLERLP